MSKKILILNGSPRSKGNTAMLCDAFSAGARSAGHQVTRFDLHKLDIHGCLGCVKGGKDPASPCVQKDDMGKLREEIAKGNIEKANHLLGYHYFVTGEILHGRHLGSTKLGIPTINQIPPEEKLLPESGVYVTEVRLGDRSYRGVTNVGVKPTIEGKNPVGVETHLLDFAGDLYGKVVTVEFLTRIREERKFSSIEALKEEMQNNIAYARAWFEKNES